MSQAVIIEELPTVLQMRLVCFTHSVEFKDTAEENEVDDMVTVPKGLDLMLTNFLYNMN